MEIKLFLTVLYNFSIRPEHANEHTNQRTNEPTSEQTRRIAIPPGEGIYHNIGFYHTIDLYRLREG